MKTIRLGFFCLLVFLTFVTNVNGQGSECPYKEILALPPIYMYTAILCQKKDKDCFEIPTPALIVVDAPPLIGCKDSPDCDQCKEQIVLIEVLQPGKKKAQEYLKFKNDPLKANAGIKIDYTGYAKVKVDEKWKYFRFLEISIPYQYTNSAGVQNKFIGASLAMELDVSTEPTGSIQSTIKTVANESDRLRVKSSKLQYREFAIFSKTGTTKRVGQINSGLSALYDTDPFASK